MRAKRWVTAVTVTMTVLVVGGGVAYWARERRTTDPPDLSGLSRHATVSADGTRISYVTTGVGPGVIVLPGALTVAADYAELARALGEHFTVHVVDRRGHGASGPQGDGYGIDAEIADVLAVRAATGAQRLVGHSFGGFVALETASRHEGFDGVALYEPGVSIHGSMSTEWFAAAEHQVAVGRDLDALTTFVRGTDPDAAGTPHWLLRAILPQVIPRNTREQMYDLLPAAVAEHRELARRDGSYRDYARIGAPVLLLAGGESGPAAGRTVERLAAVMPGAHAATLEGLDHFGPDRSGPDQVSRAITDFFRK
jgi:pimeloyl-ACP methyl ester carboxylesterase